MQYEVLLDVERCDRCWECINVCPADVFKKIRRKSIIINSEQCLGCESCMEVCQSDAIQILESCCS